MLSGRHRVVCNHWPTVHGELYLLKRVGGSRDAFTLKANDFQCELHWLKFHYCWLTSLWMFGDKLTNFKRLCQSFSDQSNHKDVLDAEPSLQPTSPSDSNRHMLLLQPHVSVAACGCQDIQKKKLWVETLLLLIKSPLRCCRCLIKMSPGCLPLEAFRVPPAGRRPRGRSWSHWGGYIYLIWPLSIVVSPKWNWKKLKKRTFEIPSSACSGWVMENEWKGVS